MDRGAFDTASLWLTIAGAVLALPRRTRRVAGFCFLAVGLGGVGVSWERMTGARFSGLREARWDKAMTAATHAPLALVGLALVRNRGRG